MAYQVRFTETTNPAKPSITVQDQTLDNSTSLTFVGKNYAGYGPIVAENFLHLLENFAKNTAPSAPVQGQLWYDNSPGVNLLKVYDGTSWTAAGSVKKSGTEPVASSSIKGDLWVDTTNQQLYVYSGSNWLLIGPQFSSGLKTGPDIETIADTDNVDHNVITMWSENNRIAIVSKSAFTPKVTLAGFATIGQGINLSTVDASSTSAPTKFWGVASTADALNVSGTAVSSSNFLRSDQTSTTNFPLNIRSNGGLNIGSDLSFNIGQDTNSTVLYSKTSGNSIDIKLNSANTPVTVVHIDATSKVGIGTNNTAPQATLDVAGTILTTGTVTVTNTTDATVLGGTASITTSGGLNVDKQVKIGGDLNTYSKVYLNNLDGNGDPLAGAVLLPGSNAATSTYDIGSSSRKFRNVYAESFVGNVIGTFTGALTGDISGSATKLASPTAFSMSGDVSCDPINFNGQQPSGEVVFNTVIEPGLITSKPEVTVSNLADMLLINQSSAGLKQITKQNFIKNVPTVPVGAIFPFAGDTVPNGYLLCDGSEVEISVYHELYLLLKNKYRVTTYVGQNTFALPDLRGRFALGRDNMDNGTKVPASDGSGNLVDAGGGSAGRVSGVNSVGAASGTSTKTLAAENIPDHKHTLNNGNADYFAVGRPGVTTDPIGLDVTGPSVTVSGQATANTGSVISSAHGSSFNIMNPFLTINYIIFTGVL